MNNTGINFIIGVPSMTLTIHKDIRNLAADRSKRYHIIWRSAVLNGKTSMK